MDAEIQFHVEQQEEEFRQRGMSAAGARVAARRRFGDPVRVREECRESLGVRVWDDVRRDIRQALRALRREWWVAIAAVLTLAIGIGANTAVFTVVNAALFHGLPFQAPEQLVWLETRDVRGQTLGVSRQDYEDWQHSAHALSTSALGFNPGLTVAEANGLPAMYPGAYLSGAGLALLGVPPALGRTFGEEDNRPGAPPVVVLGDGLWRDRFAADPAIVGRVLHINTVPATVIGVMPRGFAFPSGEQLWIPMTMLPQALSGRGRDSRFYFAFGRLGRTETIDTAREDLAKVGRLVAREYPVENRDTTVAVTPFSDRALDPQFRTLSWILLGAVGFVLVIACSSVATLLLAKAARHGRETALRRSLGATKWRIIRALLIESLMLATAAAVIGVVLAYSGVRWFDTNTVNVGRPYWMSFTVDLRVVSFFVVICSMTVILFGVAPALTTAWTEAHEVLGEAGRSVTRGRAALRVTGALLVAQLTLTLVLLSGAGFLMRSFLQIQKDSAGFDTSHLLAARVVLPARKYRTMEDVQSFIRRLDDHLNGIDDVVAASPTTGVPFLDTDVHQLFIDGRSFPAGERQPLVRMASVGPRYFDALRIGMARGRAITEADGAPGHEVAVINQRLAAEYFPNEDPIGKRIRFEDMPGGRPWNWATIIGVSPNIRQRSVQEAPTPDPVVYIPNVQHLSHRNGTLLIVRTRDQPETVITRLRQAVFELDPDLPVGDIVTMDHVLAQQRWSPRVYGTMFAAFALIGLVLSGVGLYAITAYGVTQRTSEIGIRRALGAFHADIVWMVTRRAAIDVALGVVFGLTGAVVLGHLLSAVLVETSPTDVPTLLATAIVLVAVATVACAIPTVRALRADPGVALRQE